MSGCKIPVVVEFPGFEPQEAPCDRVVLARDMCRMHYERNRKWGDPLTLGAPGADRTVPEELAEAGITARMRNHWAANGLVGVEQDPETGRYLWTEASTRIALAIKRLFDAGLPLALASTVAQSHVEHGRRRVEVAPGVYVGVETAAPSPEQENL